MLITPALHHSPFQIINTSYCTPIASFSTVSSSDINTVNTANHFIVTSFLAFYPVYLLLLSDVYFGIQFFFWYWNDFYEWFRFPLFFRLILKRVFANNFRFISLFLVCPILLNPRLFSNFFAADTILNNDSGFTLIHVSNPIFSTALSSSLFTISPSHIETFFEYSFKSFLVSPYDSSSCLLFQYFFIRY